MALPLSICLIWESDHVILKSSRKVAGRPQTKWVEKAKKHNKIREGMKFCEKRLCIEIAIVVYVTKSGKQRKSTIYYINVMYIKKAWDGMIYIDIRYSWEGED